MLINIFNREVKDENIIMSISTKLIYINSNRSRKFVSQKEFNVLCKLIKKYGMIVPIVVRSMPNGFYELISGENGLKVANFLKILKVPAIISQISDDDINELLSIKTRKAIKKVSILNSEKSAIKVKNYNQELLRINTRGSKDTRIFLNTINKAIEIMKKAGMKIFMIQKDSTNQLEIKIKLEKV